MIIICKFRFYFYFKIIITLFGSDKDIWNILKVIKKIITFLFCTSKWLKFHIICVFKWWYLVFTKQWQMQQNFQWFCISCHDNEFRYSSVECLCCWNKKFTSLSYLREIYSLSQIIASINFLLFLTIIYLSINYNWNGWKGENSKFLHW